MRCQNLELYLNNIIKIKLFFLWIYITMLRRLVGYRYCWLSLIIYCEKRIEHQNLMQVNKEKGHLNKTSFLLNFNIAFCYTNRTHWIKATDICLNVLVNECTMQLYFMIMFLLTMHPCLHIKLYRILHTDCGLGYDIILRFRCMENAFNSTEFKLLM